MKKKLAKVLSVMVAVVISVSTMVVNASAYSWCVSRQHSSSKPGAPIEVYGTQRFTYNTSGRTITEYKTTCTGYSSEKASNGNLAYARSVAKKRASGTGDFVKDSDFYYYHRADNKTETISLYNTVYYGDSLYIYYELINPYTLLCSVSGTGSVPGGTLISSQYE